MSLGNASAAIGKVLALMGLILFCGLPVGCREVSTEPLPQQAYIWQRHWSPAIVEGIEQSRHDLVDSIVLVGEIGFRENRPLFSPAEVDFAALKKRSVPTSLALRIAPFAGPFSDSDSVEQFLKEKIRYVLKRANAAQLPVAELQIDFDCPQSKLAGYGIWLTALQKLADPIPVIIIARPTWLDEPAFREVARKGYVLRLVQNPQSETPVVFQRENALLWVEKARLLDLPFRIALPTQEDAPEVARFLDAVTKNRPSNLSGVILYHPPWPDIP